MDRQTTTSAAAATGFVAAEALPPLEAGDQLDQPTFHARYEAMPESFRAELVEGMVIVPSPLRMNHGLLHSMIMGWLFNYQVKTPGTSALDNATTILSAEDEPQPDGSLILDPGSGGQTHDEDGYVVGPPELTVEVASGSEAIDLHGKFRAYQAAGVREYIVVNLCQKRVQWFVRRDGRFGEMEADVGGIVRSEFFPGLWLDTTALLEGDAARLLATLERGLATPEHAEQAAQWRQALEIAANDKAAAADTAAQGARPTGQPADD